MGLMMLAAGPGCCIDVTASGSEATNAMDAISDLAVIGFGETDQAGAVSKPQEAPEGPW